MRYRFLFLIVPLCLAGCWDERQLKDLSAVTLVGADGVVGDMKGYYVYDEATAPQGGTIIIESHGKSALDTRQHAQLKVQQKLDLSILSTFLLTKKSASQDLYEYIDIYYRDPLNPMTARIAVVDGDMKPFLEVAEAWEMEAGEYYKGFFHSLEDNTFIIPYTIQTAGVALTDPDRDLALPYLKMGKNSSKPEFEGLALFSERRFRGEIVPAEDSMYVTLLNDTKGTAAVFSYMYKENSPLSVRVLDLNRDIQISTEGITIHLDVKITIDEFPENELYNEKKRQEVQQYVQEKFNEEFTRVIKHLQKAKSDVLGLGGMVRAYENSLYKQPWRDTYSTLPIKVTSKVTIRRTGIMF